MAKPKPKQTIDRSAFRALSTDEQIRALRGQKAERLFTVEREGMDTEKRTAWLSIASEEPYERWWGVEVLDLGKRSIRDKRMRSGAPLLVGHDAADQVGVVEDFEITADRKLRILARFGKSARAEEVWQDVLDGIRRNTSVGYVIHDMVLEKQSEGQNTYRVTDWEPYEGSLVAVPADPTVGVGRSDETDDDAPLTQLEEKKMPENNETKTAAPVAPVDHSAAIAREQSRVAGLLAAGDSFATTGGPELARELIKDPTGTVDAFNARMLASMRGAQKPTATAQPHETPTAYGAGARQMILRGRVLRSFTKPIHFTDGSTMDAEEAAYRSGQWLLAAVGNNERARKWCAERGIEVSHRVMQTGDTALGGYLVPNEMEQSIIDLREAYGLARRLARRRPMGSDTRSVPKRTGGLSTYFIDEDNSGVTASDKSWGNVNLVAKTLAALALMSKNLEEDSAIDMVDDLSQEMAYAFALKEDQCWLVGDGTSTYGGMQGLITLMEATAYSSRPDITTGHDTFAEIDNADIGIAMGAVADIAGLNPVWLCSKLFDATVFGRLKATAGGNTTQTLEGRIVSKYLGYDVNTSEIMPKVTSTLDNKVMALFGDFSQSSSFGDRRGIMIEVLRERYAEKLQIGVLGHERFHIVNHDLGTTSAKGPVAALYGS